MDRVRGVVGTVSRRAPFTVAFVIALLTVAALTGTLIGSVQDKTWYPDIAYGLPSFEAGRWYSVATGTFFALSAVDVAAVFAVMSGFSEFRMGSRRTAVMVTAGQAFGILAAAGVLAVLRGHGWPWADVTATTIDVGCSAGAMATLAAATATMHSPWRGRLRFVLIMYCLVALMFVGELWDIEHALAVAIGLPAGPFLMGRRPQMPTWKLGRREWRLFAAAWTLFVAVGTLMGALLPGSGPLGDPADAADSPGLGVGGAVVVAILLLFADGLRRGRRVAWRWVLGIAIFGAVTAGLPPYTPDSIYSGLLLVGLVIVLIVGRHAFSARGDARTGRRVWLLLGLGLLGLIGYAAIGFSVIQGFSPPVTLGDAVGEFSDRMFAGSGDLEPTTVVANVFLASLTILWWGFVIAALLLVLWSNRLPAPAGERDRAVSLLRHLGGTDVSWMITWPENSYWFAADGEAVVAYRVHAGVAIGLCDPVCPPGQLDAALRGFMSYAEERGLSSCLFSVTQQVADSATAMSWKALQVAEEAVVPLPGLEFKGKKWQDVRTAINRAKKESITFELGVLGQMSYSRVNQVRDISEQWVSEKGLPEMGFTLGGVEEALDPEVRVGLALRSDGVVDGVTSWLPIVAPGGAVTGWTLDVMRRRDGGFRPVTEYLIGSACLAFRDEGAELVSLSGAPLARADDDEGTGTALDRVLDSVGEAMEPYYGFRSLHHFKAKFQPEYRPMYLVYPDEAALPRIGLALGKAYLPDGLTSALLSMR
jgi:lysylphosphatidylglycerol synthetase-like protein (DUF2156 family)